MLNLGILTASEERPCNRRLFTAFSTSTLRLLACLHGALNQVRLPAGTEETYNLLTASNPGTHYTYKLIPGYGDLDTLIGKNAVTDVFPLILEHLASFNAMTRSAGR